MGNSDNTNTANNIANNTDFDSNEKNDDRYNEVSSSAGNNLAQYSSLNNSETDSRKANNIDAVDVKGASPFDTLPEKQRSSSITMLWIPAVVLIVICIVVAGIFATLGQQKHKSQLTIGLKLAPSNLDIRNQSGTALDQLLVGNVYESLVNRDQQNHIAPGLAEKWSVSDDGLHYAFMLHKNMNFANGDKLTAHEVAWSIQQLLDKHYRGSQLLTMISSIKAKSDTELTIDLTHPYADLLWNLSGRAGLVFNPKAKYNMKTQAMGSGPYTVVDFKPNTSVTLQKNERYWGKKANIDTVKLRYFADDNAALNALKSQSIDVLSPINPLMVPSVRNDKNITIATGEDTDKIVLAFNNRGKIFQDKRVRQAIRYAIDHKKIIEALGSFDKLLGGPIPSLDPGYEDLTDLYEYNPNKAKQLLAEAGYSEQKPLDLTLTYPSIYSQQLGQLLRVQLKQVGINLHVRIVEFSTWLDQVYTKKQYDLSLVDHNDSHDFYQWANPKYYYGYDNKQVQKLYKQAITSANSATSESLLRQAARIVSQDAPADWLYNFRIVSAINKRVVNYPLNSNQVRLFLSNIGLQDAK